MSVHQTAGWRAAWAALTISCCCTAQAVADPPGAAPAAEKSGPKASGSGKSDGAAKSDGPAKTEKTRFVRLTQEKGKPTSLDIAITTYTGRDGSGGEIRVDLVGVIHIADKAYYQQLNKEFEKYDAVLYELVAPKGVTPKKGEGGIYGPLANMLDLADQLAEVDYTPKNFVHADMTGDELLAAMRKRDENLLKIVLRALAADIAMQGDGGNPLARFIANTLATGSPALAAKRALSPQFADIETATKLLAGPDGSAILHDRNQAALKVLRQQLQRGRRHMAIFYGAAHMPDMDQRLVADFKLRPTEQRWLAAWNLAKPSAVKKSPPSPAKEPPPVKKP